MGCFCIFPLFSGVLSTIKILFRNKAYGDNTKRVRRIKYLLDRINNNKSNWSLIYFLGNHPPY